MGYAFAAFGLLAAIYFFTTALFPRKEIWWSAPRSKRRFAPMSIPGRIANGIACVCWSIWCAFGLNTVWGWLLFAAAFIVVAIVGRRDMQIYEASTRDSQS